MSNTFLKQTKSDRVTLHRSVTLVLVLAGWFLYEHPNFLPPLPKFLHIPPWWHVIRIHAKSGASFMVNAVANGVPVRAMVDTGASYPTFGLSMAKKLGLGHVAPDDHFFTANGVVPVAHVTIAHLSIEGVEFQDVPAVISFSDLDEPLLGLTFLNSLRGFEVQNRVLELYY